MVCVVPVVLSGMASRLGNITCISVTSSITGSDSVVLVAPRMSPVGHDRGS